MTATQDESFWQAPTTRDEEWRDVLRAIDYLRSDEVCREVAAAMAEKRQARFELPPMLVFSLAEALQHWIDHKMPLLRAAIAIEDHVIAGAQLAEKTMRDEATRFAMAVADLEALLYRTVGREIATLEQIRQWRGRMAKRRSK